MIILKNLILSAAIFLTIFMSLISINGRRSKEIKSFLYLGLSIYFWLICYYFAYSTDVPERRLLYFKMGYMWIITIPIVFYNFISTFLEKRNIPLNYLFIFHFIFSFLLLVTNKFVIGLYYYPWGYYPKVGLFFHVLFLIYFFSIFSLGMFHLFASFFKKDFLSGIMRERTKYVLIGSLIGSMGSVDFFPNYGINIFPFGALFMLAYPLFFAYAIVKYRLMDVKLVFTRAGIFIAVYLFVLGIPFAMAFGWKDRLVDIFADMWWIVPLVSSTVLATVGPFIYLYIDRKAEKKLLKEQREYQNILRNASSGMIRIKNLNKLLNLVVHVVTKTVRIKHAAIYLLDNEANAYVLQAGRGLKNFNEGSVTIDTASPLVRQLIDNKIAVVAEEIVMRLRDESQNQVHLNLVEQLSKIDAALVIPSFVDDKLIGILVLGEKLSRKLYSEDDLVVFSVLANQAALAIENAQFYDEVKKTHEQLFQAEKMATIGTMADGLSHQINNRFHALSLISGDALDILKTYDPSNCSDDAKQVLSDLKGSLQRIEANVLQGGEVVKNLLKYSRPGESGFELVDFNDVLNGSIDMVQYKIKLKEVDLIRNIPPDLPKFHGNLTQLQEVFFNLIDNAYDATKERQATLKEEGFRSRIEISARNVDGSVEIMVSDNGMGVKDLDKKKLFTPFFTTKATAKKGTGLGLYVIDKIITAHSGHISIDSVYQSGTRFTITLPISPKAA